MPHFHGQPFENDRFQAVIVIQMTMHRRHRQVMMIMLQTRQPLGQLTLMVVVDVGQIGHAMPGWHIALPVPFDRPANQVAHRLGTVF